MDKNTIMLAPRDDEPFGTSRWSRLEGSLLIAGLALMAYLPSLHGAFLIDDERYLTDNQLISSADGLSRMWCTNQLIDYWPMTYTTFWLEWRLWGMNPSGYHFTNLILHIATSLLIWVILRKLSIPGAFLAALIFAVHPVNVEAVAWISQRKEVLAAFFLMLSILWYLCEEDARGTRKGETLGWKANFNAGRSYWLSLLAFALAMLSKSSVAILPLLLMLIVWWLHGRVTKWDVWRVLPYFCISILLTLIEIWFQKHGDPHPHASFDVRLAGAGAVVWFYLSKALLPINLSFIYPHWNVRTYNFLWWLPLLGTLSVTALLWWHRNRRWGRSLLFAWGFFCVALVPVMGFVETGAMMLSLVLDLYQHLAMIGVITLVAACWSYWHEHIREPTRWRMNALAAVLVGTFAMLTWQQSCLFGDPVKLYQTTFAQNPGPWTFLHNNLGIALLGTGRTQEAIEQFQNALQLMPESAEAHNNLGNALMAAGQSQQAIEHFETALRLEPDYFKTHYNLGNALLATGQLEESIQQFEQALRLEPNSAGLHYKLAIALARVGHLAEALKHYQRALQIQPDYAEAHNNLGGLLLQSGHLPEAIEHYQQALQFKPDYAEAHNNLAVVLAIAGRTEEAIEHFQQALRLESNNPETHHNLGVALLKANRIQEAIDQFEKALQLQPNRAQTYAKLTKAYAQIRQPAAAIATAEKALELARSQADSALAQQIEDWLTKYRDSQSVQPEKAVSPNATSPRP